MTRNLWFLVRWDRGFALLRQAQAPYGRVLLSRDAVFERFERTGQGVYAERST